MFQEVHRNAKRARDSRSSSLRDSMVQTAERQPLSLLSLLTKPSHASACLSPSHSYATARLPPHLTRLRWLHRSPPPWPIPSPSAHHTSALHTLAHHPSVSRTWPTSRHLELLRPPPLPRHLHPTPPPRPPPPLPPLLPPRMQPPATAPRRPTAELVRRCSLAVLPQRSHQPPAVRAAIRWANSRLCCSHCRSGVHAPRTVRGRLAETALRRRLTSNAVQRP